MTPRNARILQWLVVVAVVITVPWAAWRFAVRQHHLSFVPPAMAVSTILYVAEESWGFGPGGNETGIIVFAMPDAVATALKSDGLAYLTGLPRLPVATRHGEYSNWRQTPIEPWRRAHNEGTWQPNPGIGDFLFRYGFFIRIDEAIEKMVNEAIFKPGSFYAYGRTGLIILIPDERRIIFAYSG